MSDENELRAEGAVYTSMGRSPMKPTGRKFKG
jgi:hypothetical protein